MDVVVYDDKDRRYVPFVVALGLALLLAVVTGGVGYQLGQGSGDEPLRGVTEPQAGAAEEPPCAPAIEGADAALSLGARLDAALAQHSSALDDLRAGRADGPEVVDRVPELTATTEERQEFLDAVRGYEQARTACLQ